MSEFFEPPPPRPKPERQRQPDWVGPPENALGGPFPLSLVLAHTDEIAVAVSGGLAFPTGFAFTLSVRLHTEVDEPWQGPMHSWHLGRFDDDVLRFGVRFPDGSKATVHDRHRTERQSGGPILTQRGGGGGGRAWDHGFWVWPLPSVGAFGFVCEWPAYGVELTAVEIDTAPILEAASCTVTLWPDDDGPSAAGGNIWVQRTG